VLDLRPFHGCQLFGPRPQRGPNFCLAVSDRASSEVLLCGPKQLFFKRKLRDIAVWGAEVYGLGLNEPAHLIPAKLMGGDCSPDAPVLESKHDIGRAGHGLST
jgi:hypothetical protein